MIDERFLPEAFARLPDDGPEVEALCRELGAEIAAEVHRAVEAAFRRVAEQLRVLGHDLPEEPTDFDTEFNSRYYAYRRGGSADRERFHLRIHLSTQVCTFYPGRNWARGGETDEGAIESTDPTL